MKWVLGVEFVVPFSSHSQVVNLFKWKHHYLRENIAIFQSNYDLFTQYLFLNEKKVSFMTFFLTTWEQDNKSERKKGPQIPRPGQITLWDIHTQKQKLKVISFTLLYYCVVECALHCTLLYWRAFSLVYNVWKMAMHSHQVHSNKHNIVFLSFYGC